VSSGARSGGTGGREPTVRESVSVYSFCALPESDPNWHRFRVTAEYAGHDRWAVRWGPWCLDRTGGWHAEMLPSARTEAWLADRRYTEAEARELARAAALTVLPGPGDMLRGTDDV
jgi:hypothetical protein